MNRTPKMLISGIALLGAIFVAHRFWIQYLPVPIVVGVQRSLPPEFQETFSRLSMTNNAALAPMCEDSIPYDAAKDKKITRFELSRIRRIATWSFWLPYPIELIVIHDASNVTAHVKDKTVSSLRFKKKDGDWNCEVRRGHVDRIK
jgi:hypothetical protein